MSEAVEKKTSSMSDKPSDESNTKHEKSRSLANKSNSSFSYSTTLSSSSSSSENLDHSLHKLPIKSSALKNSIYESDFNFKCDKVPDYQQDELEVVYI